MNKWIKILVSGLLGGFIGEGVMGGLFMSGPIQSILYNPDYQSKFFLEITPQRDLFKSIAGMVVLSVIHAWLFSVLKSAIPGKTWVNKGLFWGLSIWLLYWVFQEWFIYNTLLKEPILLNLLELSILLLGSLVEGLIISFFFRKEID